MPRRQTAPGSDSEHDYTNVPARAALICQQRGLMAARAHIAGFGLALLLSAGPVASETQIAGVTLPGAARIGGHELALRTCGVREALWIDHYVAALYLPGDAPPTVAVQDAAQPKLLRVEIVNAAFLPPAIPERWQRALSSLPQEKRSALRVAYDRLRAGDVVTLSFIPERGTAIQINDRVVAAVPDHGLIDAVLLAWAEREPVDLKLQQVMLRYPC